MKWENTEYFESAFSMKALHRTSVVKKIDHNIPLTVPTSSGQ